MKAEIKDFESLLAEYNISLHTMQAKHKGLFEDKINEI